MAEEKTKKGRKFVVFIILTCMTALYYIGGMFFPVILNEPQVIILFISIGGGGYFAGNTVSKKYNIQMNEEVKK